MNITKKKVKDFEYKNIYIKALDSLTSYHLNNLGSYSFLHSGDWYLDSLFALTIIMIASFHQFCTQIHKHQTL